MTSTEIHQHRDPHGRHLYVTTDNNRIVLVLTSPQAPGASRVEFTPAQWQDLTDAVNERTTTHALTGKAGA